MPLVERDHEIQAFAADRCHQSFANAFACGARTGVRCTIRLIAARLRSPVVRKITVQDHDTKMASKQQARRADDESVAGIMG